MSSEAGIMAEYSFVDHWFIAAPIEAVYRTIADPRTFPQWWRDYDHITILKDAPFPHVGGRAEFLVRSPFGYRLRIVVETVAADRRTPSQRSRPASCRVRASGSSIRRATPPT
jgi:hypothetical protein